jgi:TLD/Domain of unknown function
LAEDRNGSKSWSEPTLAKFLELPDDLGSGPIIYHLCSYLGAFPFPSHEPAILTAETLLRVVCLMTGRYMKVLRGSKENWRREIWRACAEFDQEALAAARNTDPPKETESEIAPGVEDQHVIPEASTADASFVDEPMGEEEQEDDDEDELALHAFELIDALEVFKQGEKVDIQHALVPSDRFLKLLGLLLLIAPLRPQESVSMYATQLDAKRLEDLPTAAHCILMSFGGAQNPGIRYKTFEIVISNTLPYLFDSLAPLFEQFLLPRDVDRKDSAPDEPSPPSSPETLQPEASPQEEPAHIPAPEPLLPVQGYILDLNVLSQLSFIFSYESFFHRLRPIYLGHDHGYSMGSFENSVFQWQGPSILLVSGILLSPDTKQSRARVFLNDLPHRRLSSSASAQPITTSLQSSAYAEDPQRIVYGAYMHVPWKSINENTFDIDKTTLFQLSPIHDVFPASYPSQSSIYFNKPPSPYPGLGFGSVLGNYSSMTASQASDPTRRSSVMEYSASDTGYGSASYSGSSAFSSSRKSGMPRRGSLIGDEHIPLGPVSLHIDDGLEYGVFTHISSGGGSFHASKLPNAARSPGAVNGNWQDRFEIDAIEVWGLGDA